jgi:hypothetical protein
MFHSNFCGSNFVEIKQKNCEVLVGILIVKDMEFPDLGKHCAEPTCKQLGMMVADRSE